MRKSNPLIAIGLLIGFADLSSAQLTLNRTPSRAVGWPQLLVNNFNPNLVEGRELNGPQGLAIDSTVTPPVLYISDPGNNRVLALRNASSFSFGAMADFVIGQKDFFSTTGLGPGTAISSGLNSPTRMTVDKNGNLELVDTGKNRILRFPAPYNQSGQVLPDLLIGQTTLTSAPSRQPHPHGTTPNP